MDVPSADEIQRAVKAALAEDVGSGDATTLAAIPSKARAKAVMRAREPLVAAGLPVAEAVFRQLSSGVEVHSAVSDGDRVKAGGALMEVSGPARAILTGERVALNFVQRLSGIATLTREFVDAIKGTRTKILDTRKTTPGLRRLEKYAVQCGGGQSHRLGLFDMVLIKDNHLAVLRKESKNPVAAAIKRARDHYPDHRVEVEADTYEQAEQAVAAGADIVLLDNMNVVQMRLAVQYAKLHAFTEASGGVSLANVRQIAETGVDFISVGAITHSARAMDIGLDFEG